MENQSNRARVDWRFWTALVVLVGLALAEVSFAFREVRSLMSEDSYVEPVGSLVWAVVAAAASYLALRPLLLWFGRFGRSANPAADWRAQVKAGALVAWTFTACTLGSFGANAVLVSMREDAGHRCFHIPNPAWNWSVLFCQPLVLLATGVWAGRKILSPQSAALVAGVWAIATLTPAVYSLADAAALAAAATVGGVAGLSATPAICGLVTGTILVVLVLLTVRLAVRRAFRAKRTSAT
jgi:hypothetical protein